MLPRRPIVHNATPSTCCTALPFRGGKVRPLATRCVSLYVHFVLKYRAWYSLSGYLDGWKCQSKRVESIGVLLHYEGGLIENDRAFRPHRLQVHERDQSRNKMDRNSPLMRSPIRVSGKLSTERKEIGRNKGQTGHVGRFVTG
jgi:hypothetical protein